LLHDSDSLVEAYPFCLSIDPATWQKGTGRFSLSSVDIAERLVKAGLGVFEPKGAWYGADWDGEGCVYGQI
jgi:hypothetical protein